MAGTKTTPPPMPKRPTSTPTPSPSRRIMKIMVTGLFRAYRPGDSNQAFLFSSLQAPAATSLQTSCNTGKCASFFVYAEPAIFTCLCHVGPVACWRLCGRPQRGIPENVNPLTPRRSDLNRSATELMPIDRKPEFFKGAQLKVGIIGCGYVGLPLALRFAEAGHKVTGFDTDPHKVTMLNAGKSYIEHIPQNKIQQFVNSRHFSATNDFAKLKEADAIIICVPTPLDERREPDLSYVEQTAISIYPHLQRGQLVVLESTTYPGTTEELVLPILEKSGLRGPIAAGPENENVACDFYLAFSPEREDPGNKQFGLAQIRSEEHTSELQSQSNIVCRLL